METVATICQKAARVGLTALAAQLLLVVIDKEELFQTDSVAFEL